VVVVVTMDARRSAVRQVASRIVGRWRGAFAASSPDWGLLVGGDDGGEVGGGEPQVFAEERARDLARGDFTA
jgi:hypothetical protein